ncbi:MAG: DUF4238 domain-containing protein [Paludibacter sp.]|nr:DUF4238 domain-containing protein [Paludibacter sp.]
MSKKNHHYVPRFYLKRFSVNEDGKTIGLYNYNNNMFIQSAPIKHQASKDFLYGKEDDVETELAKLESAMAKLFHFWTDEKILLPPPHDSVAFTALKRFILYQLFRTPKAGNDLLEQLNDVFQKLLPYFEPDKVKQFDGLKIYHEEATLLILGQSGNKGYLLDYLDCKFIVNLSDLPFITSDSPVILYNQYMEKAGFYAGATGLPVKGLQIFYPIHPRLMICFYDSNVYRCGDSINCISTDNIDDIHQFNVMQYLNSESQLFFDETISKEYVEKCIVDVYKTKKVPSKSKNKIINTKDDRRFLLMCTEDFHIELELSFFKIICGIENFEIAPLRHPSLERRISAK